MFVVVSLEVNCLCGEVDLNCDYVAFLELEGLDKSICTLIELFCSGFMLLQLPPLALTM